MSFGDDNIRIKLTFKPKEKCDYNRINKYQIHSFIYSLVKDDEQYSMLHDKKGFKFFNFSNVFPERDDKNKLNLFISSPDNKFIKTLHNQLKEIQNFNLSNNEFELINNNTFNLKVKKDVITGTPIVLYWDNYNGTYFRFPENNDLNFFLQRITENALIKYKAFTGRTIKIDKLINGFEYKKDVGVTINKHGEKITMFGSLWNWLELNITPQTKKFYKFLLETGLGEKNSLGFGFLNIKK